MSDINELLKKQEDAVRFAMKMVDEKDPERLKEMAAQVLERTQALERMARGMEAALTPQGRSGGETTVILTDDQRARITEQTGVGMQTVTLNDEPQRVWGREMPTTEPREIEKLAAKQAAASRLIIETRKQVEIIIKELEKVGVPELDETIRELKRDPTLGLAAKSKAGKR